MSLLAPALLDELRAAVGDAGVSTDPADRDAVAHDLWPRALIRERGGEEPPAARQGHGEIRDSPRGKKPALAPVAEQVEIIVRDPDQDRRVGREADLSHGLHRYGAGRGSGWG